MSSRFLCICEKKCCGFVRNFWKGAREKLKKKEIKVQCFSVPEDDQFTLQNIKNNIARCESYAPFFFFLTFPPPFLVFSWNPYNPWPLVSSPGNPEVSLTHISFRCSDSGITSSGIDPLMRCGKQNHCGASVGGVACACADQHLQVRIIGRHRPTFFSLSPARPLFRSIKRLAFQDRLVYVFFIFF